MKQQKQPYLKDNKKLRLILSIISGVIIIAGIILIVFGAIEMNKPFSPDYEGKSWLFGIGMPILMFGLILLFISNIGAIQRFLMRQSVRVSGEATHDFMNGPGGEAYSNFIDQTSKKMKTPVGTVCPKCGTNNDGDANFCDACGHSLKVECPKCKTINDSDAKFCKKCGEVLISE